MRRREINIIVVRSCFYFITFIPIKTKLKFEKQTDHYVMILWRWIKWEQKEIVGQREMESFHLNLLSIHLLSSLPAYLLTCSPACLSISPCQIITIPELSYSIHHYWIEKLIEEKKLLLDKYLWLCRKCTEIQKKNFRHFRVDWCESRQQKEYIGGPEKLT